MTRVLDRCLEHLYETMKRFAAEIAVIALVVVFLLCGALDVFASWEMRS